MTIVVKTISPKRRFSAEAFREAFTAGMKKTGEEMEKEFAKTTATWEGDKPDFDSVLSIDPGELAVFTGPTGDGKGAQKWRWLNEGTRPHVIAAKNAQKRLAFMTDGFRAKTAPGTLASGAGRKAGPPLARPQAVLHPGTEPRRWDELVAKIYQPRFKRRMERAMREGAKRSGHGV